MFTLDAHWIAVGLMENRVRECEEANKRLEAKLAEAERIRETYMVRACALFSSHHSFVVQLLTAMRVKPDEDAPDTMRCKIVNRVDSRSVFSSFCCGSELCMALLRSDGVPAD